MQSRRPWLRAWGLIWAVAQLALPLAVSYADARSAGASSAPRAHVEAERTTNCTPVHTPECGLCRFLANHGATPVPPAPVRMPARRATNPHPALATHAGAAAGERPHSRDPPRALS